LNNSELKEIFVKDIKARGGDPWIGVDLDGTLSHFDIEYREIFYIGPIIKPMRDRILNWISEGITVKIFTARVSYPMHNPKLITDHIQNWLETNGLPRLEITNVKDLDCFEIWDDIAKTVILNTGMVDENYEDPDIDIIF